MGIRPDYIPPRFIAETVVRHFRNMRFKGAARPKALILRAKKARDILPKGLRRSGFTVRIIDLYDTVIPAGSREALEQALALRVDLVTFTSSSTVENFIHLLGDDYRRKLSGVGFASIGPVTSRTLEKFGLKPDIEAKTYTIEGLVDAMAGGKAA
ncbi:MAG: uroporphyrinogen-III synthase, partial [Candidatus Omnitrophota bacterium]|nr:uroporphyrinogen-III synthase [Candidatus Omnitrophota bacterium]